MNCKRENFNLKRHDPYDEHHIISILSNDNQSGCIEDGRGSEANKNKERKKAIREQKQ